MFMSCPVGNFRRKVEMVKYFIFPAFNLENLSCLKILAPPHIFKS